METQTLAPEARSRSGLATGLQGAPRTWGWCPPGQDPTRQAAENYPVAWPLGSGEEEGATPGQGEVPALFPDPLWTRSSPLRLTQCSLVSSCPLTPQTPNTGSQLSAVLSPSPCTFWGLWLVSLPYVGEWWCTWPCRPGICSGLSDSAAASAGQAESCSSGPEDCKGRWAELPVMVGLVLGPLGACLCVRGTGRPPGAYVCVCMCVLLPYVCVCLCCVAPRM